MSVPLVIYGRSQGIVSWAAAALRDVMGIEVHEADGADADHVLDSVLAGLSAQPDQARAVVVPIDLGDMRARDDLIAQLAERADVIATSTLGPDRRLTAVVLERAESVGVPDAATLVLAAAGGGDPRARDHAEAAADLLRTGWSGPVRVGFVDGEPSVAEAVAQARSFGEDGVVAIVSYLLAPGAEHRGLDDAGADLVTPPLGAHATLLQIVADRYHDALSA